MKTFLKSLLLHVPLIGLISCNPYSHQDELNRYKVCINDYVVNIPNSNNQNMVKKRYEYSLYNGKKHSAIIIGYAIKKNTIGLFITKNSHISNTNTFPIDNTKILYLLDRALIDLQRSFRKLNISKIELDMKTCGVANINISKKYWKSKHLSNDIMDQPLFTDIRKKLLKYHYKIWSIDQNDFYPIIIRDMKRYCVLPDTCSLNNIAIDGILTLRCKRIE